MKVSRLLAMLSIVVASPALSCTGGDSPTDESGAVTTLVGLNAVFPVDAAAAQIAVSRVRIVVLRLTDRAPIGTFVRDVDPDASEWVIEVEVNVPFDDRRVVVLVELIELRGTVEAVEWSGISDPITLEPGRVLNVGQISVLRGPADNLAVTSVSIVHPGSLVEGTGVQLTADVQTERAGAQPVLHWASADPTVATVTSDGFLEALLPGIARISAVAGAHDDQIEVSVLPRAAGLSFVVQPTDAEVGGPMDPAPSVEIVDARGHRVESFNEPVTVELQEVSAGVSGATDVPGGPDHPQPVDGPQPAPGLGGQTTVAAQGGVAIFPDLVVDGPGFFRLIASATGLSPATSADFHIRLLEADIEVLKEADRSSVPRGDAVAYTITVVNHGPDAARGIVVDEELPPGLQVTDTDIGGGTFDQEASQWRIEALAPGESVHLHLKAVVSADLAIGDAVTNRVVARTPEGTGDDPSNNEATATTEVRGTEADLEITKTVDRSYAHVGESVVYTITVKNRGPDASTGAEVLELLPLELDVPTFTVSQGTFDEDEEDGSWTPGRIEPGGVATLTAAAVIHAFAADRDVINSVVVVPGKDEVDPVTSNNVGEAILYVFPIYPDAAGAETAPPSDTAVSGATGPASDAAVPGATGEPPGGARQP